MHKSKAVIAIVLTCALSGAFVALSASDASARGWYHHRGPGPVLGLVGGVVAGAVAIATLPFAVVGAVVDPGPRYYARDDGYYGRGYPPAPPPRGYYDRGYYDRGYYGDDYGYGRR